MRSAALFILCSAFVASGCGEKDSTNTKSSAGVLIPPPKEPPGGFQTPVSMDGKVTPAIYKKMLETFYNRIGPDVLRAQKQTFCGRAQHLLTMYRFSPAGYPDMPSLLAELSITDADIQEFLAKHPTDARKVNAAVHEQHPTAKMLWQIPPPMNALPEPGCKLSIEHCDKAYEQHYRFVLELANVTDAQSAEERLIQEMPAFLRSCKDGKPSPQVFACAVEAETDVDYAKCELNKGRMFGAPGSEPLNAAEKKAREEAAEAAEHGEHGHDPLGIEPPGAH